MKIPGFITVRTTSSRLPRKCLLSFGEGNVLQHIVRRAKHFDIDPIVCTTIDPADNVLEEIASGEKVRCFRGSIKNKLQRWRDCCREYDIDAFHTVDADDPFFDGESMRRSFALLCEDYDMVSPTDSSSLGGASEGFSLTRNIVEKTCAMIDADDTEMMWYYVQKVPDLKHTKLTEKHPKGLQIRLTLDYEEDYWLLCSIQRWLGSFASRQQVEDLFRMNPDLYRINWFRNVEWKEAQLAKKK